MTATDVALSTASRQWRERLLALLECSEGFGPSHSYDERLVASLLFQGLVARAETLELSRDPLAGWRLTPCMGQERVDWLAVRLVNPAASLARARSWPEVAAILPQAPTANEEGLRLTLTQPPEDVRTALDAYDHARDEWFARATPDGRREPSPEVLLELARSTFADPISTHVLLVDDDPEVHKDIKQAVEERTPRVVVRVASWADEARERLRRSRPDAILIDKRIPKVRGGPADEEHGRALLHEVRREHPGIRVIGVTGFATDADFETKKDYRKLADEALGAASR